MSALLNAKGILFFELRLAMPIPCEFFSITLPIGIGLFEFFLAVWIPYEKLPFFLAVFVTFLQGHFTVFVPLGILAISFFLFEEALSFDLARRIVFFLRPFQITNGII